MIGEKERYVGPLTFRLLAMATADGSVSRRLCGCFLVSSGSALATNVFAKYSTNRLTPWPFVFNDDAIGHLSMDRSHADGFAGLVCGTDGIAIVKTRLILDSWERKGASKNLFVQASRRPRQRYRVSGLASEQLLVPDSAWPI